MFHWLHSLRRKKNYGKSSLIHLNEGFLPPSQDTFSAIGELSRVVRNNPDAVEIYLALGNLFRSQGEIERAIQIRTNLIARPQLDEHFKARAWFELGIDFKRAGILDRAHSALEQAHKITGDDPAVLKELARLYADANEFEKAAGYYCLLEQPLAQAHYMVKEARSKSIGGKNHSDRLIQKAVKVYPGSVEAWLEIICRDFEMNQWNSLQLNLEKGLQKVKADLRFVLLEGLYKFISSRPAPAEENPISGNCSDTVVETLEHFEQNLIFCYYSAVFLKGSGQIDRARQWLEKTLVMDQEFWPARLEILDITQHEQILTESFKTQLTFFTRKARMVKKFVCKKCGLKREQLFFLCPRCCSWHSISFRTLLNE
ncbi:MAG: tetratricopeptide repeat protein [Desulfonatronovibrio sp.]